MLMSTRRQVSLKRSCNEIICTGELLIRAAIFHNFNSRLIKTIVSNWCNLFRLLKGLQQNTAQRLLCKLHAHGIAGWVIIELVRSRYGCLDSCWGGLSWPHCELVWFVPLCRGAKFWGDEVSGEVMWCYLREKMWSVSHICAQVHITLQNTNTHYSSVYT